jgi:hypothetical protein
MHMADATSCQQHLPTIFHQSSLITNAKKRTFLSAVIITAIDMHSLSDVDKMSVTSSKDTFAVGLTDS